MSSKEFPRRGPTGIAARVLDVPTLMLLTPGAAATRGHRPVRGSCSRACSERVVGRGLLDRWTGEGLMV
jgi:hypothetical protein